MTEIVPDLQELSLIRLSFSPLIGTDLMETGESVYFAQ